MKEKISTENMSAAEIAEKYGISRATAWRAAKRGYFYAGYHGDQSAPEATELEFDAFVRVIKHPAIVITSLTGISAQKAHDIIAKKATLRKDVYKHFANEITLIRKKVRECRKNPNKQNIIGLMDDPRFANSILFAGQKRMIDRLRKDFSLFDTDIPEVRKNLDKFLTETYIGKGSNQ